jgi:hypothetical protein
MRPEAGKAPAPRKALTQTRPHAKAKELPSPDGNPEELIALDDAEFGKY